MRGSAGLIWEELCSEQTSLLVCELSKSTKKCCWFIKIAIQPRFYFPWQKGGIMTEEKLKLVWLGHGLGLQCE